MRVVCLPALAAAAFLVACREPTTQGPAPVNPSFSAAAVPTCPPHADFVVADEQALFTALGAAQANDTLAIDGVIELSLSDAIVTTDRLTFTCATPGSGLRARPGAGINWLFVVFSKYVTVERLALDATNALSGAFLGTNDGGLADHVAFVGNSVTCPSTLDSPCVFVASAVFGGMTGAVVTDNDIVSDGTMAGLQMQGLDSAQVTRNRLAAVSPSTDGIRVNGSLHVTLSGNDVVGPWSASLNLFDGLFSSAVVGNRLEGARIDGVILVAAADVQFVGNTVDCGTDECLFGGGAERVVIADNQFRSAGSVTGVQLQGGIDSTRIERNTIIATAPSTAQNLGGIRVRDGSQVVVADNVVQGPWANSIATTNLAKSHFQNNRLDGAAVYGVRFGADLTSHNVFQNNQVTGAGTAGIFVQAACDNKFVLNDLNGNGGNIGLILEATAGANTVVLPRTNTSVVIDNGSVDCDGDGQVDPNRITGPGRIKKNVTLSLLADIVPGTPKQRFR